MFVAWEFDVRARPTQHAARRAGRAGRDAASSAASSRRTTPTLNRPSPISAGIMPAQPDAADTTLDGSRRSVRQGGDHRARSVHAQRQHGHPDRRLHAGPHLRAVVPAAEVPGVRPRHGGVPRRRRRGSSTRRTRWRARRERSRSDRRRAAGSCARSSITASTPTNRARRCSTA